MPGPWGPKRQSFPGTCMDPQLPTDLKGGRGRGLGPACCPCSALWEPLEPGLFRASVLGLTLLPSDARPRPPGRRSAPLQAGIWGWHCRPWHGSGCVHPEHPMPLSFVPGTANTPPSPGVKEAAVAEKADAALARGDGLQALKSTYCPLPPQGHRRPLQVALACSRRRERELGVQCSRALGSAGGKSQKTHSCHLPLGSQHPLPTSTPTSHQPLPRRHSPCSKA